MQNLVAMVTRCTGCAPLLKEYGLDSNGSGLNPAAGYCKNGKRPLDYTQDKEFLPGNEQVCTTVVNVTYSSICKVGNNSYKF
jgi:hypothetical protein